MNSLEELKHKPVKKDGNIWLYRFDQSQKDNVRYQGADSRDLWVREGHNKEIAQKFSALGLASHVAIAAFTRYYP